MSDYEPCHDCGKRLPGGKILLYLCRPCKRETEMMKMFDEAATDGTAEYRMPHVMQALGAIEKALKEAD